MKIRSNLAVSEDGFVFDPKTGESFTVNQVGVDIINLLKKGSTLEELSKQLEKKYDADHFTIEKSVSDFLEMMKEYNLIEHE